LPRLSAIHPDHPEILFAQAYVYERQARFWDAVRIYEHILQIEPDDATAMRLKLRALGDMGAAQYAAGQAEKQASLDAPLRADLDAAMARQRLRWQESGEALRLLEDLKHDSPYAFDHIAAQCAHGQYAEAVHAYERRIAMGEAPPAWVRTQVAGAYLAIREPGNALALYDQVLAEHPRAEGARLGKFYVLQELRRWREAEALLNAIENDSASAAENDPTAPPRMDLAVVRGWFLAYQNRLCEADAHFGSLLAGAPADLEIRNGLAHVHLWRGWPRRALQEFRVIESLDPVYAPNQPGKIDTLNTLIEKAQARAQMQALLAERPGDAHLRRVDRMLAVEQMNIWRTELSGRREDEGSYDLLWRTELSTPITLKSRIFGFLLWRRTWQEGEGASAEAAFFRRTGIGLDHLVDAHWRLRPVVSVDYHSGDEPGAALRIDYTPTDHWSFGAFGDTFATALPMRARASGIDAKQGGIDAVYRWSEWRQAGAGFTHTRFSDGNQRNELSLDYQQNLWAGNDWRQRVFTGLYLVRNDKGDQAAYFNPEEAVGLSVTLMTEQTVWDIYMRSMVHRLYVTVGDYIQRGYAGGLTGALRYEQDYAFSDRHALLAGIGAGRSRYDGVTVYDIHFDLVYQWRF
jgi:biofilm PGA synthesis protein PgaA